MSEWRVVSTGPIQTCMICGNVEAVGLSLTLRALDGDSE